MRAVAAEAYLTIKGAVLEFSEAETAQTLTVWADQMQLRTRAVEAVAVQVAASAETAVLAS
jgi:hypothetical protein